MVSICSKDGFLCCFGSYIMASSADPSSYQGVEGINCNYKGNRQRCYNELVNAQSQTHLSFPWSPMVFLHASLWWSNKLAACGFHVIFRNKTNLRKKSYFSKEKYNLGNYWIKKLERLSCSIPKSGEENYIHLFESILQSDPMFHCALVHVCLLCNSRLSLFWWSSRQCLEPMYAQLLS